MKGLHFLYKLHNIGSLISKYLTSFQFLPEQAHFIRENFFFEMSGERNRALNKRYKPTWKVLIFCRVSPEECSHIPLPRFEDLSNGESKLLHNDGAPTCLYYQ